MPVSCVENQRVAAAISDFDFDFDFDLRLCLSVDAVVVLTGAEL